MNDNDRSGTAPEHVFFPDVAVSFLLDQLQAAHHALIEDDVANGQLGLLLSRMHQELQGSDHPRLTLGLFMDRAERLKAVIDEECKNVVPLVPRDAEVLERHDAHFSLNLLRLIFESALKAQNSPALGSDVKSARSF